MTEASIRQAIARAAREVGAQLQDVQGYYNAGAPWDAEDEDQLAALIVECWREQQVSAQLRE